MAGNHRSGRRPKPDALRVLEGGRARHSAATLEGAPDPPEMVASDPLALIYWTRYVDTLSALGLLGREHAEALATLSCVSADYERARKQFADTQHRAFVTQRVGNGVTRVVETPILRRLESLAALKSRLLGDFGLTPVMAAKVGKRTGPAGRSKWAGVLPGTGT